eukprot:GSChrysophyteH2.ASY1.ANO1.890.1 assembled CDS
MLTSFALYTAYKHYKKWKTGGDDPSGDDDEASAGGSTGQLGTAGGKISMFGDRDALKKALKTVLICAIYMVVGPGLILLNKHILTDLNFPYPMFLSGLGVGVSALVARVVVALGFVTLSKKEAVEGPLWYRRVLPVGLAHAGTLAFGNTVYLLLNVGFIQMLKSFTPVIILATSMAAKLENPNMPTIASIFMISMGTAATCSFTPQLSIVGLAVMFLAEFTEAIRLLMTQFLLQNLKFGVIEGQYVLAPATAFWLMSASFFYEGSAMYENGAFAIITENFYTFLLASCMGLCVNFMSYLVIQATSSLTMKVLGSVRNIFTIVAGVVMYGDVITGQAMLGYGITMTGFAAYNVAKSGKWERLQVPMWALKSIPGCVMIQEFLDVWDQKRLQNVEMAAMSVPASKDKDEEGMSLLSTTADRDIESPSSSSGGTSSNTSNSAGKGQRQRKVSYTSGSYATARLPDRASAERKPLLNGSSEVDEQVEV